MESAVLSLSLYMYESVLKRTDYQKFMSTDRVKLQLIACGLPILKPFVDKQASFLLEMTSKSLFTISNSNIFYFQYPNCLTAF